MDMCQTLLSIEYCILNIWGGGNLFRKAVRGGRLYTKLFAANHLNWLPSRLRGGTGPEASLQSPELGFLLHLTFSVTCGILYT